jgi:hypothetical protein
MKKNYFVLILIAAMFLNFKTNAQCTSCTSTISGNDAANHVVNSGATLCITSTGTATGLITVASSGILCNQGTINSSNLWVSGGTLYNYGSIYTTNILVSGQGVFNNIGFADIDSLLITNIYSTMANYGTIVGERLGNSDNSAITNNGNITEDFVGDSLANFTNGASGNLIINYDLGNSYGSNFFNYGYTTISRDFYNSTVASFETSCMINVGRDWFNSATISVPSNVSCAGFNIAGGSYNSGSVGTVSSHVDLCDAGHPATGIDGPAGTIANTTTYCSCSNNCVVISGITNPVAESNALIETIYPNPAIKNISVLINSQNSENIIVEVFDMMGRKQFSMLFKVNAGQNKMEVELQSLAQGTYILKTIDSKSLESKQLFNIVK